MPLFLHLKSRNFYQKYAICGSCIILWPLLEHLQPRKGVLLFPHGLIGIQKSGAKNYSNLHLAMLVCKVLLASHMKGDYLKGLWRGTLKTNMRKNYSEVWYDRKYIRWVYWYKVPKMLCKNYCNKIIVVIKLSIIWI